MLKHSGILAFALCANMAIADQQSSEIVSFEDISSRFNFERNSFDMASGLGGLSWFDYNNDGFVDLYLSNGPGNSNALFKNIGGGEFVDVTSKAGVANWQGTSGVLSGDIDSDGYIDLLLIGAGGDFAPTLTSPPVIYRNLGDGTFEDVTEGSGLIEEDAMGNPPAVSLAWSGAMADIDGDADLDVYMVAPGNFFTGEQVNGKLYRNDGGFTFTDITEQAGLSSAERGSCAAGFSDYNNDSNIDLFVAPCQKFIYDPASPFHPSPVGLEATPMQLFRNDGSGQFTDVTEQSNLSAYPGFWMAVSLADINHDGHMDLFSTNAGFATIEEYEAGVANDPHGLFLNNGDGTFTNIAEQANVEHFEIGWGAALADFDNDGFSDLFFAGSLPIPPAFLGGTGLGNPGRLFINENTKRSKTNVFTELDYGQGNVGFNQENEFTSGVAQADFNNDGRQDLAVIRESWMPGVSGQPLVLMNNTYNSNHWVGVQTIGTESNSYGVGAKVMVKAGGMCQFQEVSAGSSFASTDSHRLNFGIGKAKSVKEIIITWPTGVIEKFSGPRKSRLEADRTYYLAEGKGRKISKRRYARKLARCR